MKWTKKEVKKLKEMCLAETPNAEIAKAFGVPIVVIYGKRSALGLTKEKVKALLKQKELKKKPILSLNNAFEAVEYKTEGKEIRERKRFVKNELKALLMKANPRIAEVYHIKNSVATETVVIEMLGGHTYRIGVTGDSLMAAAA